MPENNECAVCGKNFDSERGLKIHQGQMHSDEEIEETGRENGTEDKEKKSNEESNNKDAEDSPDIDDEEASEKEEVKSGEDSSQRIRLSLKSAVAVFFLVGVFSGFSIGFLGAGVEGPEGDLFEFNFTESNENAEFERVEIGNISLTDDPSLGDSEAPIKVIQYTDFGCPYCSEWHGHDASPVLDADSENIFDNFREEFIDTGEVEFIVKDHPVPDLHPNSVRAHAAANCVYDQNKDEYWSFIDDLYRTRDVWTAGGENRTASHFESMVQGRENIDAEAFVQCYLSTDGSEMVGDRTNALRNIGELGTPTFLIGNEKDGFVISSGITRLEKFERAISQVNN